ncbi:TPA: conjugal transfer protein [Klebsiella pneumoniae]|uniref:type IV secretion system protein n=1 Tax=Enterobacter hormaechei TaxID=158836 RepID=UPI0014071440|nr:type IV secretion system protein [Enterobacter hormaechei]EBX4916013.1 conjugal transfer protein [Salmonella enterica subsp. enterica serovar Typhimurium]UTI09418.1 type IV secretion system protein [Enterobacter hormaechei subsp. steigerwaltii]HCM7782881.1 conjugal transfer protein [Klebsiella pneumoniae]
MKMRTAKLSALAVLIAALSAPVYSTGIPSIDAASIAQAAQHAKIQAQEALAQLNAAKDAIAQAKAQYDKYEGMVKGNANLGDWLRDENINDLFPTTDWADIYDDAENMGSLRSRYGLTSSDPNVQKQFDKLLAQAGFLEKNYKASSQRIKKINSMRKALNTAVTPQQKEDLALRLQDEQLELKNQEVQLQNTRLLMEQKEKINDAKYAQDMSEYYAGKTRKQPTRPVVDAGTSE